MRGADSVEIIEICRRGRENKAINMAYKRIGWKWREFVGEVEKLGGNDKGGRENKAINMAYKRIGWKWREFVGEVEKLGGNDRDL